MSSTDSYTSSSTDSLTPSASSSDAGDDKKARRKPHQQEDEEEQDDSFTGAMFDDSASLASTRHRVVFPLPASFPIPSLDDAVRICVPVGRCNDPVCPLPPQPGPIIEFVEKSLFEIELAVSVFSRPVSADTIKNGGDLTGFTLFVETKLLCDFLIEHADLLVRGKRVCEVGAGISLPSHVAVACGAEKAFVTDGLPDVIAHVHHPALKTRTLQWREDSSDDDDEEEDEKKKSSHADPESLDDDNSSNSKEDLGDFSLVFGSGIAYAKKSLHALLATVRRLLHKGPESFFVCGFKARQIKLSDLLAACEVYGFHLRFSQIASQEEELGVYCFELKTQ